MQKQSKKYPVPNDIVSLLWEHRALLNLRDVYAMRPFGCGYKKARKAAVEAEKLKCKASQMIRDLYPELDKRKTWSICDLQFGDPYLEVK